MTGLLLPGDGDWTVVRRRFPVPAGGGMAAGGLLLSMAGDARVDNVRVEAAAPLRWNVTHDGPCSYVWLDGDEVALPDRQRHTAAYERVRAWLGVEALPRVTYDKTRTRARRRRSRATAATATRATTRCTRPGPSTPTRSSTSSPAAGAPPPALVGEGLAVHLSGAWAGRPAQDDARELVAQGRWVPLDELSATDAFRAHPTS